MRSVGVRITDTVRDCVELTLNAFKSSSTSSWLASNFGLWVRTRSEEAPYPLIGHELPLIIKLNWTRNTFNKGTSENNKCVFILRRNKVDNLTGNKTKLKKVKSSIKLQNVFRRMSQSHSVNNDKENNSNNSTINGNNNNSSSSSKGNLFGRPLEEVCKEQRLPAPVESMLKHVLLEGPGTVGIFRRSPNARAMRELREKLDARQATLKENNLDEFVHCSVFVTAALLKDFLRSLPDCLLMCQHFDTWVQLAAAFFGRRSNIDPVKSFVSTLPRLNCLLLQHLLFVLKSIALREKENMMSASNLAICVGPSMLWSSDNSAMMTQNYSKNVSSVAQLLIEHCSDIFGDVVPAIFDNSKMISSANVLSPNKIIGRTNEEGSNNRSDNSSVDSLLESPHQTHFNSNHVNGSSSANNRLYRKSTPPRSKSVGGVESGLSLTNLSQDSGLTNSNKDDEALSSSEDDLYKKKNENYSKNNVLRRTTSMESMSTITVNKTTPQSVGVTRRRRAKRSAPNPPTFAHSNVIRSHSSVFNNNSTNKDAIVFDEARRRSEMQRRAKSTNRVRRRNDSSSSTEDDELEIGEDLKFERKNEANISNIDLVDGKDVILSGKNRIVTRIPRRSSNKELVDNYEMHVNEDELMLVSSPRAAVTTSALIVDTPPGYEETISRQRLLRFYNRPNNSSSSSSSTLVTNNNDRPPLPPKQKLIRATISNDVYDLAPSLPPKEATNTKTSRRHIIHLGSNNNNNKRSNSTNKRGNSNTKISSGTQTKIMCHAETQTDEADFYLLCPEDEDDDLGDLDLDEHWLTESVDEVESNASLSPELYPVSLNSHVLSAQHANRRKLEPVQSVPIVSTRLNADPVMQGEIHWSVSRLRSLFNKQEQMSSSESSSNGSRRFATAHYSGENSKSRDAKQVFIGRHNNNSNDSNQTLDSDQESYV